MKILPLFILPHIHDNTRCVGPPPLILHASHNLRPASFLPHRRRQLHLSLILPLRRHLIADIMYIDTCDPPLSAEVGKPTPAYYLLLQSESSAIEEDYTSSSTVIKDDVSSSGETRDDDARPSPSTVHAYVEVGPDRTRVLGPRTSRALLTGGRE